MTGTSPHGFTRRLLVMLASPLIWFAHFSFIYGAAGFGGAFGLDAADIRALSWGATVLACGTVALVLWRRPHDSITRGLAFLSLLAISLQALVLWMVPP